jgi:phage-related protein
MAAIAVRPSIAKSPPEEIVELACTYRIWYTCRNGEEWLFLHGGVLVALHGFIKKTQKTSAGELTLARKRQKDLKS